MTDELSLRLLTPEDFSQMYRTFIDAFSNYSVKMDISKDAFRDRMESKLNISYAHSVGTFHGEKLVGFIFNTVNYYEDKKTAYNGGTGVLPDYWGRGLTRQMYEFLMPKLKAELVERCVLEVITSNHKAIKAYKKVGFYQTKVFKCFKLKRKIPQRQKFGSLEVQDVYPENLTVYEPFSRSNPSMLDSLEQLPFNLKKETCLHAYLEDQMVGYIIFQHKSGRISQMAIKDTQRRKGFGTILLHHAQELSTGHPLTILNIEEKEVGIVRFFQSNGFVNELDQYEMEVPL